MKLKPLMIAAALALIPVTALAAEAAMDCCKDCACCQDKEADKDKGDHGLH